MADDPGSTNSPTADERPAPTLDALLDAYFGLDQLGDPLAVWQAYRLCFIYGAPPPAWVVEKFTKFAFGLEAELGLRAMRVQVRKKKRDWTTIVLEVFGFSPGPGQKNPLDEFLQHRRDVDLAVQVLAYVTSGHNPTDACWLVAQDEKVSEPMVRRAWTRYGHIAARLFTEPR